MNIPFRERPLAITDVETTGLHPDKHEIIEIGLILADQKNGNILDKLDIKIKPAHIETASPRALEINGYKPQDWVNAVTLRFAMQKYADKVRNGLFCAHNITFDWGFIDEAFKKTGVSHNMDYHRIDLLTLAWRELGPKGLERLNLDSIAKFLGVPPEPKIHRGINGAFTEYLVLKKLLWSTNNR
jgi:DNA polymerase-3 subunit epsilon